MKAFLPIAFNEKETLTRKVTAADGSVKQLSWRNYRNGSGEHWDIGHYTKYFPSIRSDADIHQALRVLSHARGNWLVIR